MSRAMLKGVGKVRGGGESGDRRGPWRKVRETLGMSSAMRGEGKDGGEGLQSRGPY